MVVLANQQGLGGRSWFARASDSAWKADTLHAGFKTVWEALEAISWIWTMVMMACAHEAESPFPRQTHTNTDAKHAH